jgi:hypothetical protein
MLQLEAKIETGRHNLKIKMDKELYRLQKEIGLHVNDIKRIQGLMSRLAVMHGKTNDEIKRNTSVELRRCKVALCPQRGQPGKLDQALPLLLIYSLILTERTLLRCCSLGTK